MVEMEKIVCSIPGERIIIHDHHLRVPGSLPLFNTIYGGNTGEKVNTFSSSFELDGVSLSLSLFLCMCICKVGYQWLQS